MNSLYAFIGVYWGGDDGCEFGGDDLPKAPRLLAPSTNALLAESPRRATSV